MESHIKEPIEILNCGLQAISEILEIKTISIKSLLSIAEDNEINLYAYHVNHLNDMKYPCIAYYEDHFKMIETEADIELDKFIGIVISEFKTNLIQVFYPESFKGQTWVAAGVASAALTAQIGTKISENKKAKKAAKKLDAEKAEEKALLEKKSQASINIARGLAAEGDPTLAEKQRQIDQSAADVVGKATATSGSTQEVINAAQAVQAQKDDATNLALSQAAQFKINAKKFLAGRFTAAGQQRLQGISLINQEAAAALAAISANAQANVDTAQSIGSSATQIAGIASGR